MAITIRPVQHEDLPELGRICFEAFGGLQKKHNVECDFDSVETAQMVVGWFGTSRGFAGFAAVDEMGKLVGSNFLQMSDAVAGVGPITIDPASQARGVGTLLMQAVLDEAERRGIARVRLQQETINTASMSLYTKLGFDWREAMVMMNLVPAAADDARMRPVTEADLGAIDAISKKHYGHSRRNEVLWLLNAKIPGFMLKRDGRDVGYYFIGFVGHGFAETAKDLADLMSHTARHSPPPLMKTIVPLGQHALHRELLARGFRSYKMFNYMTYGPWEQPVGAWIPSVGM